MEITADTLIQSTLVISEIEHRVTQIDYKVVSQSKVTGLFRVEDLARCYRGSWAMDRTEYDNKVVFKGIRKGDIVRHTEYRHSMEKTDLLKVWSYYCKHEEQWEEDALRQRLNRDAAIEKMTNGTPLARAKVAVQYPEYQDLVPVRGDFTDTLYQEELAKLKKSVPSAA